MIIAKIQTASGEVLYAQKKGEHYYRCQGDDILQSLQTTDQAVEPLAYLPPLQPSCIYAIGLNYRAHATEMDQPIPQHPVVTMKNPASVIGHQQAITLPRFLSSDSVDYECELAVVIGQDCKNISADDASDYILGYTCANDVSARDWQKIYSGGQWCKGKSFDTFCPLGPYLATPASIPNPNQLTISTHLNGQEQQHSHTSDMIFDIPQLVAFLSASTTLLAGTVILTGTPSGVGTAQNPPRYLKAGDEVTIRIEGLGQLTNPIVEEEL